MADPYLALAPAARNRANGTRNALIGADREITASPDRMAWDGRGELRVGCPSGGSIAYAPGSGSTDLRLRACAFTDGVPLTGTGSIAAGNGALQLDLESGGTGGSVTYSRSGRGEVTTSGRLAVLD